MQTAWNQTYSQGDSYQVGVIGSLGSAAADEQMTLMQLEIPMLTLAQLMSNDYG